MREVDIIPAPPGSPPPKRLRMFVFMRKVVVAMPSNNLSGADLVCFQQLVNCAKVIKRRMPEGLMWCDLKDQGGDETDYFVNDAAAQRAAPMIRERKNWVKKGVPIPPLFPSDPVVDEDDFA